MNMLIALLCFSHHLENYDESRISSRLRVENLKRELLVATFPLQYGNIGNMRWL